MIGYVILHYKKTEVTIKCIESLLKITQDTKSDVVIVDNGSNNGSYEILYNKYKNEARVSVIKTDHNLGFAKGNNYGYKYLKMKGKYDFIIVCNNDLVFEQECFEKMVLECYSNEKFDVAGPDIVNMDGFHQNPHRLHMLTYKEIIRKNRNKRILLNLLYFKKRFPLIQRISIIESRFFSTNKAIMVGGSSSDKSTDMVLQGSCIIFSKEYCSKEENAFDPHTFLYFEEDLLALKCKKMGYKACVCNCAVVKHLEGQSTSDITDKPIDSQIFVIENMLKSGEIYKKRLLTDGNIK